MFELEQNKNACPSKCEHDNTVAVNSAGASKRAPVKCFQLEDRLMYSASPVPIEVIDAVSHEIAIDLGDWHGPNESLASTLSASELIDKGEDIFSFESIVKKDLFQAVSLLDLEQLDQMTDIDSTLPIFDQQSTNSAVELVVVDTNVEGYQLLVDQILNSQENGQFEFIYLSTEQNGFDVIRDQLGGHQKYDALHIISHGSDSIIQLGGQFLSLDNLNQHASTIAAWQNGLTGNSDILIYGCDVAGSSAGQTLLQQIAELTNSDVAGSNDTTGAAAFGGDWELEFTTGLIETQQLFFSASPQWDGTLEMIVFQDGTNGYASTQDTYIHEDTPNTQHGSEATTVATDSKHQTLIRFEDIFGNSANEITFGSEINSAQLTVSINSAVAGSTVSIYQLTAGWDETSTWNSMVNGIQIGTESLVTADDTGSGTGASITFDVTNSVQNWANGATNFGWLIVSDSPTPLHLHTVESGVSSNNPSLQVDIDRPTSFDGVLITTKADVTSAGTAGLSAWGEDSVLQFNDPNFQLGSNTNGTFSELLKLGTFADDSNAKVQGLHYVTTDQIIGNANSFQLLAGDVIFTVKDDETFNNSGGGSTDIDKEDVAVFRPDTPGDYSSGTIFKLLERPNGNGDKVQSITLVEQSTVVGDVTLNAGDFLYSASGDKDEIRWFQTNNVGIGTTTGTVVTLILGDDLDFGGKDIQGIELIERPSIVGGQTYFGGEILVALGGTETIAGTLNVTKFDIFSLDVTQTTFGSGTTLATPSLVFDGADVNFDSGNEEIYGFALMPTANTAPTATHLNQIQYYNEGDAAVQINNITVEDLDLGDIITATLTLDNTSTGTLSATSGNGETYNPVTGIWTITGSINDVNAALANVVFNPQATNDVNSNVAVQIRDQAGVGPGGVIQLRVASIDLPDYQGLLISTSGDNIASGTPGINSWTAGSILQVSDPNFQLGDNTNGTFSEVIDFTPFTNDSSAKLHGLHFVTQNMTVGNANSFTLQAGDIIFASKTDEVFKSSDGSTLNFLNSDIGVYRPDSPGDYSNGMFFKLLDSPNGNSGEIRSITLVEQDTVVGDVTLNQGDFLFSQRNANTENILWFQTNNVGESTTSGTVVTLINGNDIGFNGSAVQGLELIEHATEVGGMSFTSGQIIVAMQGNETVGGSVIVRAPDAFVIDATQTTAGSGTTVATAAMVFDGSDVNMTSFDEFVFSVALMPSGAIAPSATNLNQVVNYNEDVASVNLANIVVSDPDTGDTLTVTLTLDNTATGSLTALSGNGESYNAGTGTWTVTGTASQVNAALANVSFIPQSNNDINSSIAVQVSDAMGNGPSGSISLVATGVNDPPVLTELAAGILAFVEDGGAVRIGNSIDISDIDSTQMQSIQIRITGGYELGQDQLLFTNTANLTGVWNQASGTLTITGSATTAEYENALRQVGFINHSDDPSVTNRIISYRVTDQGGQQSNTINRTMTVTPTNDAPIAQTDTFALNEDTTANFTTNNLIGNDTDPDGDTITFVTINQPANGTLTHNGTVVTGMLALPINATLVYTPNQHYNGTDTATYTISDGTATSTGTVQFVVAPVEDPPVAVDDSINTDNASAFDVANAVIRNDFDPDGSRLRVIISQQPTHGQITFLNGTLHYIPDPEFAGVDTFTYQLNDGTFTSNTATVTISIDGVSTGGSEPEPGDGGGTDESPASESTGEENNEESNDNEPDSENENDENTESGQGDLVGPNQVGNEDDSESADVITDPTKADASNGQYGAQEEESGATSRLTTASYQVILVGDQQRTTSSVSTKLVSASFANQAIEVSNLQTLPGNMLAATFLDKLDSVTSEMKHDAYANSGSVATVAGISGVLTVGYVLWLVRSGFLVASFVSTMPAWQMVDPLAVVEYSSSNVDDVEDDALEDMIHVNDNVQTNNGTQA